MYSDLLGLVRNDVSIGASLPFFGGFEIGLFATDGTSDIGCNTDAGIFFKLNQSVGGFGKFKLGSSIGISKGGRGNSVQTGSEFSIGAKGLGVTVQSSTGSGSDPDGISIEGGVVAAYGADQTVNISLSIGDLARLTAAIISGNYSHKIFGIESSSKCGC